MIRLLDAFWAIADMVRKMNKIRDSISLGLASGLFATVVMDLSNTVLFRAKKSEMLMPHLAGSMIMSPFRTHQRKNFILGQILHLITGAALGIPLVYLFKRTGKDHHLIKGATMGLLSWGFLYDFGQRMNVFSAKTHFTKTHYSSLWNNFLYGIIAAQSIVTIGDPSLFPTSKPLARSGGNEPLGMNSETPQEAQRTIMWTPEHNIETPSPNEKQTIH